MIRAELPPQIEIVNTFIPILLRTCSFATNLGHCKRWKACLSHISNVILSNASYNNRCMCIRMYDIFAIFYIT